MHSFRDNYKSTRVYRALVNANQIVPTTQHEEPRFIPNYTSKGTTYDVRHLDRFLGSQWGCNKLAPLKSDRSQDPHTARTLRTDHSSEATLPRPVSDQKTSVTRLNLKRVTQKDKSYVSNLITDFSIRETKNAPNMLAVVTPIDQERLTEYYEREFTPRKKEFNPSKLVFSEQPLLSGSPQKNREQLEESKIHQIELNKWKQRNMELSKKARVFKSAYRSGVLGLDNPSNEKTQIYKNEQESIFKITKDIQKIEKRRFEQLKTFRETNSFVEFSNPNFDSNSKTLVKNQLTKVDMEHTRRWENTRDRLFHDTPLQHSAERAVYLRNQETRGKNWDIISSANLSAVLTTQRDH